MKRAVWGLWYNGGMTVRASLLMIVSLPAFLAGCLHPAPDPLCADDLAPPVRLERLPGPDLPLVRDGRPVAALVVAPGDGNLAAARLVRDAVFRITGAKLTLLRELDGQCATNAPALHFGETARTRRLGLSVDHASPEAFRVVARDETLHFLGHAPYAAADWCERQLGVRRYGPEKPVDFTSYPRARSLAAARADWTDAPVFAYRRVWSVDDRLWLAFAKEGASHPGGVAVHAPAAWNRDPDLLRDAPDIFALDAAGNRAETPLLCYGNPRTLEVYRRRIDDHIAGRRDSGGIVDTARRTVTVCQWDSASTCLCGFCRELADPDARASGTGSPVLWGHFLKRLAGWLARAHPDYRIAFLPYRDTCDVPKGLDLTEEGNCQAMVCTMPGLALLKNDACRREEEERLRAWARATGRKVLNWHYGCWPAEFTHAPYVYGRTIARHYRAMRPLCAGSFVNGGFEFPRFSLSMYVWMRCLWNPDLDVEAVYDAFARRLFGRAAAPMRALVALQEAGWERAWPDNRMSDANVFGRSYPADVRARMASLLSEALARTRDTPDDRERVLFYASAFGAFFADGARADAGGATRPFIFGERAPRLLRPAFGGESDVCRLKTEATGSVEDGALAIRVAAEEPEPETRASDRPRGETRTQDTVTLTLAPEGPDGKTLVVCLFDLKGRAVVWRNGVETPAPGVRADVETHADGWTMRLRVPLDVLGLSEEAFARGALSGNLARWRPAGARVAAEWSRLETRGLVHNDDRGALVPFVPAGGVSRRPVPPSENE